VRLNRHAHSAKSTRNADNGTTLGTSGTPTRTQLITVLHVELMKSNYPTTPPLPLKLVHLEPPPQYNLGFPVALPCQLN